MACSGPSRVYWNLGRPGNGESDTADADLINRAYLPVKDLISLRYLPKTEMAESDALLLLLYGYEKLKGQDAVLGTQLLRAAKQSGLTFERVDRPLSRHESLLLKGGARKGTKYSLNNQGRIKAMEILRTLLNS